MIPKNNNKRGVNRRATQNKTPKLRETTISGFTNIPSYVGIPDYTIAVPGLESIGSTTVTTGVMSIALSVTAAQVQDFTRFSGLFDEVRVRTCTFELIPLGIYTGVTAFFYSELNLGAPILHEAQERNARYLKNNEQSSRNVTMSWRNRDFSDAAFQPTSALGAIAYFYAYTDNANFGSPITVAQLWMFRPTLVLQFRGLKSA